MKRMSIYEPAMCCDTGVCGVNVDPELVRMSTVINILKKNGITIERYNLSGEPMAFANNEKVKEALDKNGVDILPLILVDDEIVIEGRYPKNDEIMELLQISKEYFKFFHNTPFLAARAITSTAALIFFFFFTTTRIIS